MRTQFVRGKGFNMEKSLLKSKIIMELEEKIEQGNNQAMKEFLCEIELNGAPLIEKLSGDIENALVTFVYKADADYENVVIIPPVGMDNLVENKMEKFMQTNLWYITYKVRNDVRFSYYFSPNDSFDDDWQKRFDGSVHDRFNRNVMVFKGDNGEKDLLVSYAVMINAEEHTWVKERNDVPKGKLEEHQFKSGNLENHRKVRIYTPHEYSEENKPYGFLVLTDGEEYINILSAVQVMDNLIADKKIPPIVSIFIDSTETRGEELMCSDTFGDIIVKELIPWVRENYNISNKADETLIGGLSLGGLTASYLGLKHSQIFGNVLSQSGSHWYKPEGFECYESDCWMSTQFKAIDKLPLKFYLNVGILESKDRMIDTNINLRDSLISKGYAVEFEEFKSGHDYLCWGETLANGLISLIGMK
jgi:enterochelin esterase-like enzyme